MRMLFTHTITNNVSSFNVLRIYPQCSLVGPPHQAAPPPSAGECNRAQQPLPPSRHGSPTTRHHPSNADKEDSRCAAAGNQDPQIVLSDSDDDIITSSLAESICSVQQFLKRDRLKRLKAPLFKL